MTYARGLVFMLVFMKRGTAVVTAAELLRAVESDLT